MCIMDKLWYFIMIQSGFIMREPRPSWPESSQVGESKLSESRMDSDGGPAGGDGVDSLLTP